MKCFADTVSDYPVDIKLMFHAAQRERATHLIIAIDKNIERRKVRQKWFFYPHECYFVTRDKGITDTDMTPSLIAIKKVLIAQDNVIIVEHEFKRHKQDNKKPVKSINDRFNDIANLFDVKIKNICNDYSGQSSGDIRMCAEFSDSDFKKLDKDAFMAALELEFYGAAVMPHGPSNPYISVRITEESQPWAW
jgi:hypothetical protein